MKRARTAPKFGIIGGLLLALGLAAPVGCSSFANFCQKKMDCEGGNDRDVDACIVGANAAEDDANTYGCSKYFDELRACIDAEATCVNAHFTAGNNCDREQEHFNACTDDDLRLY